MHGLNWNGVVGSGDIFQPSRNYDIAGCHATQSPDGLDFGFNDVAFCSQFPVGAGSEGPGGTDSQSNVYAADGAGTTGLRIYDCNLGPVIRATNPCVTWAVNVTDNHLSAAPASLNAALPQWIRDVVADVTEYSSSPWTVAQALTRGDAATPNTGPFRSSPGGLP
jgi:hypothetical protein